MNGEPMTEKRGRSAYYLLWGLDAGFRGCSDSDLLHFFELIEKLWIGDREVLAWQGFREGEILISRELIQGGRRRFSEAERLAQSENYPVLYRTIFEQKLFRIHQQFYLNPSDWLRDGVGFSLVLAIDDAYKDYRNSFADNVDKFIRAQPKPPFTRIADAIDSLKIHWKVDAFLVAVYAVWKIAKGELIIASSLHAVESYLRKSATFLTPDDF